VVCWGNGASGQTTAPSTATNVIAVAAGAAHTVALRGDGTVVAWGNNCCGQTTVPAGLNGVVAVSAGSYYNLALRVDSTVVSWGSQTIVPIGLSNVVRIVAGTDSSFAVKADGSVVGWGMNDQGQTDIPSDLNNVIALAAGAYHVLALTGPPSSRIAGPPLQTPSFSASKWFRSTIPTMLGHNYKLEAKESLSKSKWDSLYPITLGDGFERSLTDTNAIAPQRVYRVLVR
jgi:hypothetical protein